MKSSVWLRNLISSMIAAILFVLLVSLAQAGANVRGDDLPTAPQFPRSFPDRLDSQGP